LKPQAILERVEVVIGLDGGPRRLREVIEEQLSAHFTLPPIQAAEQAERLEPSIANLIANKQQNSYATGTLPILVLMGVSSNTVIGSCRILPTDGPLVVQAKSNRPHAKSLLQTIQALTFTDFERFGACVLRELGAHSIQVTPRSGDQGIDFFGVLNLGKLQQNPAPFFHLAHDVELRFAGQAKHYPTVAIGPDVLRELIGAISLARYRAYSSKSGDPFERLALRPFNPLLPLVFTTGDVTSGAIELASRAGIIVRSGWQLAIFLADHGIGMKATPTGPQFDAKLFLEWLIRD
jgi:hypothetical protein